MRRLFLLPLLASLSGSACAASPPTAESAPATPAAPQASSQIAPVVVDVPPAPTASAGARLDAPSTPGAPPSETPPNDDVMLTPAPSGAFAGSSGNLPQDSGVTGLWTAGDVVLAVGTGFAYRSSDRGVHFTRLAVPVRFPTVWGDGQGEVFVAGENGFLRSTDGGLSFASPGAATGMIVQSIGGPTAAQLFVAGSDGKGPLVARSRDHGATWQRLKLPIDSGWLFDVGTTGKHDVIVTGHTDSQGVVLRSTDDGNTWKRLPAFLPDRQENRKLCFSEGTLFVSSTYGLYRTRDLGASWHLATDVGAEVLALACRGKEVVVGGRNRALFVSHDLGVTWSSEALTGVFTAPSLVSVQAVAFAATGESYIGFEGLYTDRRGTLLRRSP